MEPDEEILGPRRFSDDQTDRRLPLTHFERTAQAMNVRQENLLHKESQVLDRQKLRHRREMDRKVEALKQLSSQLKEKQGQLLHPNQRCRAKKPLQKSLTMDSEYDGQELLSTSKHLRIPRPDGDGKVPHTTTGNDSASAESFLSKSSETSLPHLRFKLSQTSGAAHECESGVQGQNPKPSSYCKNKDFLASSYPPKHSSTHRIKSMDALRSDQPKSSVGASNPEWFAVPKRRSLPVPSRIPPGEFNFPSI